MEKNEKGNWCVEVDGNTIMIENKSNTLKLLINDKINDVAFGLVSFGELLTGKLPDGRKVKARIGGDFKFHCYILVDDELVFED